MIINQSSIPENLNTQMVFIALLGPSSAGKTVLLHSITKLGGGIILSTTTRPPRKNDLIHNIPSYKYITNNEYKQMLKNNMFIASMEYDNYYYGTSKESIKKIGDKYKFGAIGVSEDCVEAYKEHALNEGCQFLTILVTPRNFETKKDIRLNIYELKDRLEKRGFNKENIEIRLKLAEKLYNWVLNNESFIDETIITTTGNFDSNQKQLVNILKKYDRV